MRVLAGLGALGPPVGRAVAVVAALRRGRPLHPHGVAVVGTLRRHGGCAALVGEWLAATGTDDVVGRLSRGGGLPRGWPDVHGLALHLPAGDLLLSTAVADLPVLRHLPGPRLRHGTAGYGSLLPYEGPDGPLLLRLRPRRARRLPQDPDRLAGALAAEPLVLDLDVARPWSRWCRVGTLELTVPAAGAASATATVTPVATDPPRRFDPLRPPVGLRTYDWVRRLRSPAYTAARRVTPLPDGIRADHRLRGPSATGPPAPLPTDLYPTDQRPTDQRPTHPSTDRPTRRSR